MREEQKKQFFAMKEKEPNTVRVGGKFGFNSLPKHIQDTIKRRFVEKDSVMARGLAGEIPGLKIDGRQVTKDNIKDFEIPKMGIKVKPKEVTKKEKKETVEKKWDKKELKVMTFGELKEIASRLGETGRSVTGLIKDILKHN